MLKETRIAVQESQFRDLAELAWTRHTIYARDKEQFRVFKPRGQCGVTNFGLGVWLVWRGLADPRHLFYVEGAVHSAEGEIIDDSHAWLLRSKRLSNKLRHTDLALDQYVGIGQQLVRAAIEKPDSNGAQLCYKLEVADDSHPSKMTSVTYVATKVTPIADYDVSEFDGRLDMFLGSCYNSVAFAGHQAMKGAVEGLWLPPDSVSSTEARLNVISTKPCDAQLFTSI